MLIKYLSSHHAYLYVSFLLVFFIIFKVKANHLEEITIEVNKNYTTDQGYPLPLAAHWNCGVVIDGYDLKKQVELLKKGHRILPWIYLPMRDENIDPQYYSFIKYFSDNNLPISFISTQWERELTDREKYFGKKTNNPNVINLLGSYERKVSPFGLDEDWQEIGKSWAQRQVLKNIQNEYPEPPKVIFLSNNEHAKLQWHEALKSKRFIKEYGALNSPSKIKHLLSNKWNDKYKKMIASFRSSLINKKWKKDSIFIGYNAFGPSFFGRWFMWQKYSLMTNEQYEPWQDIWEGSSVPYYLHNWSEITDYQVWSPQIEAMNWLFMLEHTKNNNNKYWFEMSVWDGHKKGDINDKREYFKDKGQPYSAARYKGYIQFGMWLLRPRVVREFRHWAENVEESSAYFDSVLNSVDIVHENDILRRFWRTGHLVKNTNNDHPYKSMVPSNYAHINRWYLLDTDVNNSKDLALKDKINVYSIALARGKKPDREWLVYAHSPLSEYKNIIIEIPEYKHIKIDTIPSGSFYHINENNESVDLINLE